MYIHTCIYIYILIYSIYAVPHPHNTTGGRVGIVPGGMNAGPYIDSLGYICGGPVGVIIGYNHGNNPGKLGRAQVWGVLMGI